MTAVEFIEPLSHDEGVKNATDLFRATYGEEPAGVWAAPGRVNLIGEHTDYNAGLCLPIALPHRTFIALKPREDTKVRVVSDVDSENVTEADLDGLQAGGVEGWAAYPVGVAWALREAGFDAVQGFDAAFSSCVPLGSGLSSSAAMTCSTALALDDVYGLGYGASDAGRVTLINAAIKSENDMAGASTGGLDQNASMRCTFGHALRLDCRPELSPLENVSQQEFDLDKYGLELLVLDTQAPHQLNDGQYAQRRATCEKAAEILGVANLRVVADSIAKSDDPFQALKETLDKLEDDTMKKRVRHVITEIARVNSFVRAFANGKIDEAGRLFNASHDSLAADYEVTVPELDIAVDVARANGAYGARMTGGGFGGCSLGTCLCAVSACKEGSRRGTFEKTHCDSPSAKEGTAASEYCLSDQPNLYKFCQRTAYRSGHHRRSVLLWNADPWDSVCWCGLRVCGRYCAGTDFWRMDWRRSWRVFDPAGRTRQGSVVHSLSAHFAAGGGQSDLSQGGRQVRWASRTACADGCYNRRRSIRRLGDAVQRTRLCCVVQSLSGVHEESKHQPLNDS